jgi:hypothetical protein
MFITTTNTYCGSCWHEHARLDYKEARRVLYGEGSAEFFSEAWTYRNAENMPAAIWNFLAASAGIPKKKIQVLKITWETLEALDDLTVDISPEHAGLVLAGVLESRQ